MDVWYDQSWWDLMLNKTSIGELQWIIEITDGVLVIVSSPAKGEMKPCPQTTAIANTVPVVFSIIAIHHLLFFCSF